LTWRVALVVKNNVRSSASTTAQRGRPKLWLVAQVKLDGEEDASRDDLVLHKIYRIESIGAPKCPAFSGKSKDKG
jgi:hypothetical protein